MSVEKMWEGRRGGGCGRDIGKRVWCDTSLGYGLSGLGLSVDARVLVAMSARWSDEAD